MACVQPLPAWRTESGAVHISSAFMRNARFLEVPCGKCVACQTAQAKAWALRCSLELQQHDSAVFTTLTYEEKHRPVTLTRRHIQLWLKRLRRNTTTPIRFFASGEYGETTGRPHYHAILYGMDESGANSIEDAWALGHCKTDPITPARIAYTAGYTAKKSGWYQLQKEERVNPETGEVYTWQPPFIQMSRRPGIGAHARQWPESWRLYAVQNGQKQAVPRYLHEAWKQQATEEEKEQLEKDKETLIRFRTYQERQATQRTKESQQAIAGAKRHY